VVVLLVDTGVVGVVVEVVDVEGVVTVVVVVVVVVVGTVVEAVVDTCVGPERVGSTANHIPLIPCPKLSPADWSPM
jgi:hypothetical protein